MYSCTTAPAGPSKRSRGGLRAPGRDPDWRGGPSGPVRRRRPRGVIAVTAPGDQGLGTGPAGSLTRFAHDLYAADPARRQEAARQIWLRFADRLAAEVRRRL